MLIREQVTAKRARVCRSAADAPQNHNRGHIGAAIVGGILSDLFPLQGRDHQSRDIPVVFPSNPLKHYERKLLEFGR